MHSVNIGVLIFLSRCIFAMTITISSNICADANSTRTGVHIQTTSSDFFSKYYSVFQMSDGWYSHMHIFEIYCQRLIQLLCQNRKQIGLDQN